MANSSSSSRKTKVDESNNGRHVRDIGPVKSGSPVLDATVLRRSSRETSSKNTSPSPSSIQKSERHGKQTSLSPVVKQKSENCENQKDPSPLRRSKRFMNPSSLASSDSKSLDTSTSNQKKDKKHKSVQQLTFEAKEVSEDEEHDAGASQVKNKRMNARDYRAMLKRKPQIDCPKESVNFSTTKDKGEIEASITAETFKNDIGCMPQKEFSAKIPTDDEKTCLICKHGGRLLFCDGKGCNGCYHHSCLEPPMIDAPLGIWHCHLCSRKKIELGVYSVSEGVESICKVKEVEAFNDNGLTAEKQFLVKYKGLAYVHSRWVPENQLLLEAPFLLEKFNQKDQALCWKAEWSIPHRLILKRAIYAKQNGDSRGGLAVDNLDCHYEWLVKWRGLGYEHASWELDNLSFFSSPEAKRLIKDYEDRHQREKSVSLNPKVDKKLSHASFVSKLSQMPGGVNPGLGNSNLDAVNKLREHWQKGQNAIVIDDHDRVVKVVSFVLSLQSDTYRPFLIISTSAALGYWEDEFFRCAQSVNVVIYNGSKEIRKSIRELEFYKEGDYLLFEVLIVLPEIIIEDIDVLRGTEWEAIIVDECQCSKISSYLEHIKMLKTDLKILLLSGQLKDSITECRDILALLDCQSYNEDNDDLTCNILAKLKDRLSSYVAYKCKSDSFRFVEYWFPVKISNVQLEQYCATLFSNSSTLRSTSKSGVVEVLRDILVTLRKCCNHPYLVDDSLQALLIKGLSPGEFLNVGIKASGKLQVLDSMLTELKKQGSRVLILFQSVGGSGKVSLGDILDDLMRQRFGPDSYERVDKYVVTSKKQKALEMFNNKDHGRFVFLLETNACLPSTKLSSVDTIIIFDSDWNPLNDIRSLQKITLDSKLEQIKILRLYSSLTVEERALVLAKQNKPVDSHLENMSSSVCHMLLMWGASYLFDYFLKASPDDKIDDLSVNSLSGQSSLHQAVQEFSSVLKQGGEGSRNYSILLRAQSILLRAQPNGLSYSTDLSLPGESNFGSPDLGPSHSHSFWKKLLEGKNPSWKYSCGSSQRSRKRVQNFDASGNRSDFESEDVAKKRLKVINNVTELPSSKYDGEKSFAGNREGNSGDLAERVQGDGVEYEKVRSLQFSLKSEIVKLSQVLLLPDNVRRTADEFLEYVMNHHHVTREPVSVLQAFQISLCWTAASLEKHKIDHEASLLLARQHLHFDCKKEEADYIYSLLRCLKRIFLYRTGNSNVTGSPKTSGFEFSNKNYSCREFPPEIEFLMKDISRSIKEIQKKCRKKLRKLLLKHDEDKKKLKATYEGKKADLEEKYKLESAVIPLCIPSEVMRREKLKDLDISYNKKIEDLKCQHEIHIKDLETVLLEASQKIKDREAGWVEAVKSWARDELLNILPSKEHWNLMEYLKSSEQAEPDNGHVAEGANIDRIVEAMAETGVGLSKTSEQVEPVSNPVDVLPANQSSPESVTEPLEQVHLDMQNSSQQVEPVSSPVDTLPADQSNHISVMVMEPLEQVQQLPSAQSLNSILGSARESQKSPQQVDPMSSLVNSEQLNPSDHTSLVTELPEQVQQLSYANSPSSNQDTFGEMLISSQQFEPVSRQADETSANQSNYESSVMEPLEQVQQLPSAESPNSNQDPSDFPLATGIELQPVNVDSLPSHVPQLVEQVQQLPSAESPNSNQDPSDFPLVTGIELQPVNEDSLPSHVPQSLMEIANQAVVQPSSNSELDSPTPVGASSMHSSDTRNVSTPESNNRLIQTASQSVNRMLPPLHNDPLKNELERILKEEEQTKKNHEDTKLQLKSDCERELEEIRLKYDHKLQEAEVEFQKKSKILDSNLSLVLMNKIWAEAFKSKCMDLKVSGASVLQQDANFAQQFLLSRQQRDIRPPFVASPSSRPSASTLPRFSTVASSQTMVSPLPTMTSSQNMAPPRASSQTMVPPLPIRTSSQTMVLPLPTVTSSQTMVPPSNMVPPRSSPHTPVPPVPTMTGSQTVAPPRTSSQTMVLPLPTVTSSQTMVPPSNMVPPRSSPHTPVPPVPTMTGSQIMAPPRTSSHTAVLPLPTMTGSQTVAPHRASSQTMVPPLQAGYGISGISSSVSARQPSINSPGNHQAGGGFRATPPHLQSYRPSTSMPDASRISTQQAPNSIPGIPSVPNHPRSNVPTYISDPHNRVHRPVILPARDPSVVVSSADSVVRDNSARQPTSSDVVCLSDDD